MIVVFFHGPVGSGKHAIVGRAGGRTHYVELTCSREAILERLGNKGRFAFGKMTDRGLYEDVERQGGFEFPPLPEPLLQIDTEQVTAEQAAMKIAAALGEAELS